MSQKDELQDSEMSNSLMESNNEQKKKIGRWTPGEDNKLQRLIKEYGEKSWRSISDLMEGRSAIQCLHRWTKILKPGLRKGPWQEEEDEKLLEWVRTNGSCKWSLCAENISGRSGKQCRERWFNNLNPNVKKGGWTAEEDEEIFRGYLEYSSSWSKIAKNLVGRTENSVKNRFYSTVRKLLADQDKEGGNSSLKLQSGQHSDALHTFVQEQLNKINKNKCKQQEKQTLPLIKEQSVDQIEEEVVKEDIFTDNKQPKQEGDNFLIEEESCQESQKSEGEVNVLKRKAIEAYPEQNLLYKLLKQQGGPIKRTLCMKDYSTIYKTYKKRYNQKKRDKKLSEKVEILRKLIQNKEEELDANNRLQARRFGKELIREGKNQKLDIQSKINILEGELAQMQMSQQKKNNKKQTQNNQVTGRDQQFNQLSNEQMTEFQHRLMDFFNKQLSEVMQKFSKDNVDKKDKHQQQQFQMIFAPTDVKIVYPPANMPPDIQFTGIPNIQVAPNMQIPQQPVPQIMAPQPLKQLKVRQIEQRVLTNNVVQQEIPKRQKSLRIQKRSSRQDNEVQQSQQEIMSHNSVGEIFQVNHLEYNGIKQLSKTIQDGCNDKNNIGNLHQENKVDQKMLFLVNQLHTLESMLTKTKQELGYVKNYQITKFEGDQK